MNPYRYSQAKINTKPNSTPKLRTLYRKFLIWFYGGKFLTRFPEKCWQCGKRSSNFPISGRTYQMNHFQKCGHRRDPHLTFYAG